MALLLCFWLILVSMTWAPGTSPCTSQLGGQGSPTGSWVGFGRVGLWVFALWLAWPLLGPLFSFLRNLLPSGPHVLPVGLSEALEDSFPAWSNCYQRWGTQGEGVGHCPE